MADYTYDDLAKMIDHSLLQPTMTDADLQAGCRLAGQYGAASVCIKPAWVKVAAGWLKGTGVKVGTTIGFPHGGHTTSIKVAESREAMADGATELDMVVNIGKVLSGDYASVAADIMAIQQVAVAGGAIVKVIFENCYLKDDHKRELCRICGDIGVAFVKTSTGYGTGGPGGNSGATDDDLKLMRQHSPARVQVKAAGGVRTFERLLEVRKLGVTRVGATATAAILDEARKRLGLPAISAPKAAAAAQEY